MAPIVESVSRFGNATLRGFEKIKEEDRHNIQTHTDYMTMLVRPSFRRFTHSFTNLVITKVFNFFSRKTKKKFNYK